MGLFDRLRGRGAGGGRGRDRRGTLDRASGSADLAHLEQFVATRRGVEGYVEPRTAVTETTILLVAADGEWTRRRIDGPEVARRLSRDLAVPVYDAQPGRRPSATPSASTPGPGPAERARPARPGSSARSPCRAALSPDTVLSAPTRSVTGGAMWRVQPR
jgi:hypothetical protein